MPAICGSEWDCTYIQGGHELDIVAARTGVESGPLHASLLQELCLAVRFHRAQAALRRRAELD